MTVRKTFASPSAYSTFPSHVHKMKLEYSMSLGGHLSRYWPSPQHEKPSRLPETLECTEGDNSSCGRSDRTKRQRKSRPSIFAASTNCFGNAGSSRKRRAGRGIGLCRQIRCEVGQGDQEYRGKGLHALFREVICGKEFRRLSRFSMIGCRRRCCSSNRCRQRSRAGSLTFFPERRRWRLPARCLGFC